MLDWSGHNFTLFSKLPMAIEQSNLAIRSGTAFVSLTLENECALLTGLQRMSLTTLVNNRFSRFTIANHVPCNRVPSKRGFPVIKCSISPLFAAFGHNCNFDSSERKFSHACVAMTQANLNSQLMCHIATPLTASFNKYCVQLT
jgi:hypothetical protein